jgi:hypothetical protein
MKKIFCSVKWEKIVFKKGMGKRIVEDKVMSLIKFKKWTYTSKSTVLLERKEIP